MHLNLKKIILVVLFFFIAGFFAACGETRLLLRRMAAEPARIGAISVCSRAVYHRMAREVLQAVTSEDDLIIELGSGTGVGTQVLLDHGVPADKLLCVELDPELHKYMTKRFPQVRTVLGDAANLAQILGEKSGKVAAIVSSIPLTMLPPEKATAIVSTCHTVLKPQGKMAQVTLRIRPTITVPGFERSFGGFVLWNLPPAFIWTLTKVE